MHFEQLKIPGLVRVVPKIFSDLRGRLVKLHHRGEFERHGLPGVFAEEYFSVSDPKVLRGLHYQNPPREHGKLVYCIAGELVDVSVDLRVGSPTFGQWHSETLSAENPTALYVPAGMAHGFYVPGAGATIVCKMTTVYAPECDAGIHFASVELPWPADLVVSEKDRSLPRLSEISSPFQFAAPGERRP